MTAIKATKGLVLIAALGALAFTGNAKAAETPPAESPALQKCLKRADALPDIAAVEAEVWIKKNGGDDAHICRAFAQANRGMHVDAAREYWGLASIYDKQNAARGVVMHNFSGQEFLRAKDAKNAEAQFATSLKASPDNVPALVGRAEARMETERYWDALDDLNRALKISPDNIDALRQRGRAWSQLANEDNAREDFAHAAVVEGNKGAK